MAAIWAGAMMAEFLSAVDKAQIIMEALKAVLCGRNVLTYDLGGDSTTTQVGRVLMEALKAV